MLDPLVYPDAYCSTTPSPTLNGTAVRPLLPELASLELQPTARRRRRSRRCSTRLGQRPRVERPACSATASCSRRSTRSRVTCGAAAAAAAADVSFGDFAAAAAAGRFEQARTQRYIHAGLHGAGPKWFVLTQMFYNAAEVEKLLAASDVVLINYGLHYCQPSRAGADGGCAAQFRRHETELRALFGWLEAGGGAPGRARRRREMRGLSRDAPPPGARSSGDWETRSFSAPRAERASERCRCTDRAPRGAAAHGAAAQRRPRTRRCGCCRSTTCSRRATAGTSRTARCAKSRPAARCPPTAATARITAGRRTFGGTWRRCATRFGIGIARKFRRSSIYDSQVTTYIVYGSGSRLDGRGGGTRVR